MVTEGARSYQELLREKQLLKYEAKLIQRIKLHKERVYKLKEVFDTHQDSKMKSRIQKKLIEESDIALELLGELNHIRRISIS